MTLHPIEIEEALSTFSILVDTREQPTERALRRYDSFGVPYSKAKLDYGDYAYQYEMNGKRMFDPSASVKCPAVVERKMNLDELAGCFTHDRDRFEREFERAKANNARVYLLVENGNFEGILNRKYRSKFHPNAFMASVMAWQARYDFHLIFCKAESSGRLIREILYRELKERLACCEYEQR